VAGEAGEVERLRAATARLRAVNERQAVELSAARDEIARLAASVEQLTEVVAELQRRLGQDSSNSSRPPSSEGLGKKPVPPRTRGGRRGKQPGSPGQHLAQVADPDEVVDHSPSACEGCGGGLDDATVVGVARRQVFDLPEVRAHVVEHRAQRRRCGCGHVTAGAFPPEATAPACYGPGVRAAMVYLQVAQHLPVARAAQLLGDLLGIPVATGTAAGAVGQAAAKVAPSVEVIRRLLAAADVAHFDETGARVAGRLHWVHVASTAMLTLLFVHPKRGTAAMDAAGVLPDFAGTAVHDCWSPYWSYATDHALCGAHLLRELTAAAETGDDQDWANHLIDTLVGAKGWADDARTAGRDRIDPALLAALAARYDGHLTQGRDANPRGPGRRRTKAQALIDRLDQRRDQVLRFTVDLAVPFDNNQAERDVRMVKLQQKISGSWRTLAGAEAFCAVRSYICTARKHGVHVYGVLRDAMTGDPWTPPTSAAALPTAA
jgi:transposase